MKKLIILICFLFFKVGYSQQNNNVKYVLIPLKYDFMDVQNQFRLITFTKEKLVDLEFKVFYENEIIPTEITNSNCLLSINVEKVSSFTWTKLKIIFKDCQNKIVFESQEGKSKIKDFKTAYTEALKEAFVSVKINEFNFLSSKKEVILDIKHKITDQEKAVKEPKIIELNTLLAVKTVVGFDLKDKLENVVYNLFSTSKEFVFIANKNDKVGVVFKKDINWFFEYKLNGKVYSELINVNF